MHDFVVLFYAHLMNVIQYCTGGSFSINKLFLKLVSAFFLTFRCTYVNSAVHYCAAGAKRVEVRFAIKNHCTSIKGTVLRDLDGLLVDRDKLSIIRNEPLIVSKTICCFLVCKCEFCILQRVLPNCCLFQLTGLTLFQTCQRL
jgi:hypothetical protein